MQYVSRGLSTGIQCYNKDIPFDRSTREYAAEGAIGMSTLPIIIDGIHVQAEPGRTILEAALHANIQIPHACYEPNANPPVGGCRLCCVELNGKIVYACSEVVAENMRIRTKTSELEKLRHKRLHFPG